MERSQWRLPSSPQRKMSTRDFKRKGKETTVTKRRRQRFYGRGKLFAGARLHVAGL
ncbi:Uncharacterized protein APZ42_023779 [Daphnia magna]|uniref:Uncharacterized protein n=1 Tax=Daphnia magna TaxID=35525 RepID=A0A164U4M2_9CRUS|nr:Uncharacterized protein APZ42_023779 [Daphnia magna]